MSESNETPSKLDDFFNKISEQEWFTQIKNKWSDVDPQKQITLQVITLILCMSFFIGFTFYGAFKLQSSQQIFAEKIELLSYLKNIQSEIQTLNRTTREIQSEEESPQWEAILKSTLTLQGLAEDQIEIKKQKEGSYNEQLKEYLYAIQVKNTHLKPLLKAMHALESQMKPLKIRKINIDSKGNKEPVDAQIYISGFALATVAPPAGK